MGRGDLPADGAPRLGPVQLPPGRRIVPWDGPGQPAAWVTREPVPQPGPVWSALSGLHAGTGLVPVPLDDGDSVSPCRAPGRIDQVDPAVLARGPVGGARLLTIGPGAEIQLLVDRPPRTREAAEQIAVEHCVFCDECAGQGLGSVPEVAAAILDAPIWTFWWD